MTFRGGYNDKPYVVPVHTIDANGETLTFVHADKNAMWLLAACKGSRFRKGDLKRSRLLETPTR